jgi:hypothetical protein
MENLTLILWIALYPLVLTIGNYYIAKTIAITKEKQPSKEAELLWAIFSVVTYIAVIIKLWN